MGVERWLFQKLGKPSIEISGEVQADIYAEDVIDWINQDIKGALLFSDGNEDLSLLASDQVVQFQIPEIHLRGGCELDALSHYLRQETSKIISHTNYPNGAFLIRQDSTTNMALSLSSLDEKIKNEIDALSLNRNDFDEHIFVSPSAGSVFVISAWGDLYLPIYRHNEYDFEIEVALMVPGLHDLTRATPEDLENYFNKDHAFTRSVFTSEEIKEQVRRVAKHLASHYTYVGMINEAALRNNLLKIFKHIPTHSLVYFLLPNYHRGDKTAEAIHYHNIVRDVAQQFSHVIPIDITQYINQDKDLRGATDHFDRMVYFNIYKELMQQFVIRKSFYPASRHTEKIDNALSI